MTVLENLEMGAFQRSDKSGIERGHRPRLRALPAAGQSGGSQKAGTLSGGEQQMCAIGRALMARPKLLLLDEPSMGLAPILVERIFEIVTEINQQGTTILLVEQNALMALDVANRGYVLETGARRAAPTTAEVAAHERAGAQGLPRPEPDAGATAERRRATTRATDRRSPARSRRRQRTASGPTTTIRMMYDDQSHVRIIGSRVSLVQIELLVDSIMEPDHLAGRRAAPPGGTSRPSPSTARSAGRPRRSATRSRP